MRGQVICQLIVVRKCVHEVPTVRSAQARRQIKARSGRKRAVKTEAENEPAC